MFKETHNGTLIDNFVARFQPSQVDMIVVNNEADRESLIEEINSLQKIGGYNKIAKKDKLILISKITTINEIKKNY